jgi:histidine triad (HIT) family protein
MNEFIQKLLLKAIKAPVFHRLISRYLSRGLQILHLTPLRETSGWMAFCHPYPSYPVHIIIVPKKPWKDWLELDAHDPVAMKEFVELTQTMIRDFELTPAGYRLITNGGANQTFPHLHFHLVAGDPY